MMSEILTRISRGRAWWVFLLLLGLLLEATALYYQYGLDEPPCVLCIHVRIGVLLMIAVALLGMAGGGRLAHLLNLAVLAWLIERSWQLLAIERGWTFGECDMLLGTPDWLPLDRWLPWLFEVKTACGYTPLLPGGISMAEALMGLFSLLGLVGLLLFAFSWRKSV